MKKLNVLLIVLIVAVLISGCESKKHGEAVAEYNVSYDIAKGGTHAYDLTVFEDGIGKFVYRVYTPRGKRVLNKTKYISSKKVDSLLSAIEENDFWNIPNEKLEDGFIVFDGETIKIKGKDKDREHEISYRLFDDDIEVCNILNAFADFGDTIADPPEINYD